MHLGRSGESASQAGGGGGPPDPASFVAGDNPGQPPQFLQIGGEYHYDPAEERESVRSVLALVLTLLLVAVALLLIIFTATNLLSDQETKELAAEVLSPIVAVAGTALGSISEAARAGKIGACLTARANAQPT